MTILGILAALALVAAVAEPSEGQSAPDRAVVDAAPAAVELAAVDARRPPAVEPKNLVEVASEAGRFETLLTAAEAAGMVDALTGEGPLTVFAPTDDAFEALPDGALPSLLDDPEKLRAVLAYHVVPGRVTAEQVLGLDEVETLGGGTLEIRTGEDGVRVNDAKVVQTDVMASNGVIHVIDSVLLPPEK